MIGRHLLLKVSISCHQFAVCRGEGGAFRGNVRAVVYAHTAACHPCPQATIVLLYLCRVFGWDSYGANLGPGVLRSYDAFSCLLRSCFQAKKPHCCFIQFLRSNSMAY